MSALCISPSVRASDNTSNDSSLSFSGYLISIHQGASGGILVHSLGRRRVQTGCSSLKETGKGGNSPLIESNLRAEFSFSSKVVAGFYSALLHRISASNMLCSVGSRLMSTAQ